METNPANIPLLGGAWEVYMGHMLIYPDRPISTVLNEDMNVMEATVNYNVQLVWDDPKAFELNITCGVGPRLPRGPFRSSCRQRPAAQHHRVAVAPII